MGRKTIQQLSSAVINKIAAGQRSGISIHRNGEVTARCAHPHQGLALETSRCRVCTSL